MAGVNWNKFLREDENKQELFSYLSHKKVGATQGKDVLVNHNQADMDNLMPCIYEEAHTCIAALLKVVIRL